MQKITAFNQNNQALEIEIIRYFKQNEKKYLIFTLGEKDANNYIKVYVSKILGLNGTLAAYDIIDETEWANVKELIKKIIKENREGGKLEIEDLSIERLYNIKINGQQVFKLVSNLLELLGSNIDSKPDNDGGVNRPTAPQNIEIPIPSQPVSNQAVNVSAETTTVPPIAGAPNVAPQTVEQPVSASVPPIAGTPSVAPQTVEQPVSAPVPPIAGTPSVAPQTVEQPVSVPVPPVVETPNVAPQTVEQPVSAPVPPVVEIPNVAPQTVEQPVSVPVPPVVETPSIQSTEEQKETNSDFEKLYQDLFVKYNQLLEENTKLKTQLDSILAILK